MSDVLNLSKKITAFNKSERFTPYSKIIINVTDDIYYEAGDSTGRTLALSCPWGTQEMANNILAHMRGFAYQPYSVDGAIVDPAAELGDGINVNGLYSGIYRMDTNFNSHCSTEISAPSDEEIDYEYQYKSKQQREVTRKSKHFAAQLSIQQDKITAEVEERKSDIKTVKSTLEVQSKQIVAKVSKNEGSSSTFGWALETDSWRIFAGSSTVLKATKDGLEVKGKITAQSGEIGGFEIKSDHLNFNDYDFNDPKERGIYIGALGIKMGQKFQVSTSGTLIANKGYIGGFAISSSDITTKNKAWDDENENGIYIGALGIKLGKNFAVDAYGNLTANSGTFTGAVNAGSIRYGGDYGTLSGSGLSSRSVGGSAISLATLTTSNMIDGIKSSLSYADFSNGVFGGWNQASYVKTSVLVAYGATISDLTFQGHDVRWTTITDARGISYTVLSRSDA